MTTYTTSFDSYTADVQPSDWTARWTTTNNTWLTRSKAGAEGGKCLENVASTNAYRLLTWDALDADANRANTDILVRVRSTNAGLEHYRLMARGSGAAGSETAYCLKMSGTAMSLERFASGSVFTMGSAYTIPAVNNAWYYARFRVNGTSLQGKFWKDGDPEPDWQVSATNSSITAAGWVGVIGWSGVNTRDMDWFSVGTNGDTPLLSISTTTPIRVSQVVSEAALATVAPARVSQVVAEVALATVAPARVSQMVVEAAISAPIDGRVSQMVVEVAFSNAVAVTQQPRMIVVM